MEGRNRPVVCPDVGTMMSISQDHVREEAVRWPVWSASGKNGKNCLSETNFPASKLRLLKATCTGVARSRHPWGELDLVIEAVVEDAAVKTKLFQSLPLPPDSSCIIASNTSSLSIGTLAEGLSPSRRTRFLGLHFFNPAPVMKLVEVVAGPESDVKMCEDVAKWFREKKKVPALCQDRPGFIVNRVARNFYGEALRLVGDGREERCREVDGVLRDVGGFRMGPFELMDLIGVDVNYQVTCSIWEAFDRHPRFEPHPLQKSLVEQGRLGKKSSGGFYP